MYKNMTIYKYISMFLHSHTKSEIYANSSICIYIEKKNIIKMHVMDRGWGCLTRLENDIN